MTTSSVAVGTSAYVSLGNGPMLISPQDRIMIVSAASQPAAATVGHPIDFTALPFYFPLSVSEDVWAIATNNSTAVIVTV
jgi:hypothetical protein